MHRRLLPVFAFVFAAATTAQAQNVIFDSGGFQAYATGPLNGQNGWAADNPPGTAEVGAFGVGGSTGVRATGGATNWFYPTLNFTPTAGQVIVIECDIARTLFSATGSFGYAIDLYSPTGRIGRFGLAANNGNIQPFITSKFTAGQPDPNGAVGNVVVGSAVAANTFVHFEARLDFSAQSFRLLINNVDLGVNLPFTTTATTLADADIQVSSATGQTDFGYFDNYRVSVIPEPATLALSGFGALGLMIALRRRRS